jgi:hypothetical protein
LGSIPDYAAGWGGGWTSGIGSDSSGDLTTSATDTLTPRPLGGWSPMPDDPFAPGLTGARRYPRSAGGRAQPEPFAFPSAGRGPDISPGRVAVIAGLVVGLAAIGGLTAWLVTRPSTPHDGAQQSTAKATQAPPSRDRDAEARLLRSLPPGYPPNVCRGADPSPGILAIVNCGSSSEPGGPLSAIYQLARNKAVLDNAFTGTVRADAVMNCPGNIQSPGPWRRNATPQTISGTLVCGIQDGVPVVAWTDEERLLISLVRSEAGGPTLDQLYQWWSTHS